MDAKIHRRIATQLRLQMIVWFALIMTLFSLGLVIFAAPQPLEAPPTLQEAMANPMVQGLAFAALGAFIAGIFMSKLLLSPQAWRRRLEGKDVGEKLRDMQGRYGQRLYSDEEITQILTWPEEHRLRVYFSSAYFIGKLIPWGLSDSIAILGFLSAFNTHTQILYLPFAALALISFLIHRPSENEYTSLVRAAYGVSLSRKS
jgi:hypothetical protein